MNLADFAALDCVHQAAIVRQASLPEALMRPADEIYRKHCLNAGSSGDSRQGTTAQPAAAEMPKTYKREGGSDAEAMFGEATAISRARDPAADLPYDELHPTDLSAELGQAATTFANIPRVAPPAARMPAPPVALPPQPNYRQPTPYPQAGAPAGRPSGTVSAGGVSSKPKTSLTPSISSSSTQPASTQSTVTNAVSGNVGAASNGMGSKGAGSSPSGNSPTQPPASPSLSQAPSQVPSRQLAFSSSSSYSQAGDTYILTVNNTGNVTISCSAYVQYQDGDGQNLSAVPSINQIRPGVSGSTWVSVMTAPIQVTNSPQFNCVSQ
jgi:hypothetical protein